MHTHLGRGRGRDRDGGHRTGDAWQCRGHRAATLESREWERPPGWQVGQRGRQAAPAQAAAFLYPAGWDPAEEPTSTPQPRGGEARGAAAGAASRAGGSGSPRRLRHPLHAAQSFRGTCCRHRLAHGAGLPRRGLARPSGGARLPAESSRALPCCGPPSSSTAQRGGERPRQSGPAAQLPRPGGAPQPRPARHRPGRKKEATGSGKVRTAAAGSFGGWGAAVHLPCPRRGRSGGGASPLPPLPACAAAPSSAGLLGSGGWKEGVLGAALRGRRLQWCRGSGIHLLGHYRLRLSVLFFCLALLLLFLHGLGLHWDLLPALQPVESDPGLSPGEDCFEGAAGFFGSDGSSLRLVPRRVRGGRQEPAERLSPRGREQSSAGTDLPETSPWGPTGGFWRSQHLRTAVEDPPREVDVLAAFPWLGSWRGLAGLSCEGVLSSAWAQHLRRLGGCPGFHWVVSCCSCRWIHCGFTSVVKPGLRIFHIMYQMEGIWPFRVQSCWIWEFMAQVQSCWVSRTICIWSACVWGPQSP